MSAWDRSREISMLSTVDKGYFRSLAAYFSRGRYFSLDPIEQ